MIFRHDYRFSCFFVMTTVFHDFSWLRVFMIFRHDYGFSWFFVIPSFFRRGIPFAFSVTNRLYIHFRGLLSSVGIATGYGLDGRGIESRWGRDFPPIQTGPGAHPASCKMGTGSFPGVKCGRGVLLTTDPHLVPRSWRSRSIPLPTLWAKPGL